MDDPVEIPAPAPEPPADPPPADPPPADPPPADPPPAAPPAEPAPIVLAPVDDVGSALDGIEQARAETEPFDLAAALPDWVPVPPIRLRGQLFVRPVAGALHRPGQAGSARLGASVGHRYWLPSSSERAVTFGGEERLSLTAPVGGARGYAVGLGAVVGPWVGPVGLRVGPSARIDRLDWGGEVLPVGVGVGALGEVALALGKVAVVGAVEPVWLVAGRTGAGGPVDELGVRGGLGWRGRPLEWLVEGGVRTTAVGPVYEGGLSVALRVF